MPHFGITSPYYQPGYVESVIGRAPSPFSPPSDTFSVEPEGDLLSCGSCGQFTSSQSGQSSTISGMPLCHRCFTWWMLALLAAFIVICCFGHDDERE